MIEGTLNQCAIWKHVTGQNKYAEPQFAEPVTIKVRWEGKRRLVRNTQGKEVISESRALCLEAIEPEDTLAFRGREWTVITVTEFPGLDGQIRYREVAV